MFVFFADMPAPMQERVVCSVVAAARYEVPANIVLAVAEKEGGKPGQWVKNTNGTYDVGSMQINTDYLKDLSKYGITASDVAVEGCYPYNLAAWRLRGHIKNDEGDIFTRAANYHSRTPKYNNIYRADLISIASKWAKWLDQHYETIDLKQDQVATSKKATSMPKENSYKTKSYTPRSITFN